MAQYSVDPNDLPLGEDPPGFTKRWDTSFTVEVIEESANNILRLTASDRGRYMVSIDEIDADPDRDQVEVVERFRVTEQASNIGRMQLRASGIAADANAYLAELSGGEVRVSIYDDGDFDVRVANSKGYPIGTFFWRRTRAHGDQIKTRTWEGTPDDEPAIWDAETTDSTILGAGWVGPGRFREFGANDWDFIGIGTDGDPAPTEPVEVGGEEADVITTQAAQLTSADTVVYRTLDAGTLQALQTVSASVSGIFDASASTRQQQQRAEAAADVVATITLDAVTRQAQQGTAASVLLRAKIDALTRQQPQLAQVAAEIVGIISAAAETQQQPQRATADLQSTTSVSVGTQQQPQTAAATALVATILQTVTRQLPQRTTAAFGDLVRARIQATSIRRAIDLQTSITRP